MWALWRRGLRGCSRPTFWSGPTWTVLISKRLAEDAVRGRARAGLIGQRTAWLLERHGLAAGRLRGARPSGVRVRPGRKAACFDYAALGGAAHHLYPQQFLVDALRSAGGEIQFGCGLPGPGGSATILAPDAPAVTTASGAPPRAGTWARRSRCSPMRGPVWARAPGTAGGMSAGSVSGAFRPWQCAAAGCMMWLPAALRRARGPGGPRRGHVRCRGGDGCATRG
jgi:hypothetical protein